MAKSRKVIITCAVTGSIHTPTMSPHLPITPDEIAAGAIEAAEAGASILHLHARDPETGRPTPDPEVFMQFLPRIKQSTDAVVNITTGGGQGMSLEERLAGALRAEPEMTSRTTQLEGEYREDSGDTTVRDEDLCGAGRGTGRRSRSFQP